MTIAVPEYSGYIFQHFGRSEEFRIYDVDPTTGTVRSSRNVASEGRTHGQLAAWLREDLGVDVVICGGIGPGMQDFLRAAGIRFYGGVTGSCDKSVEAFLQGHLQYNEELSCTEVVQQNGENGEDSGTAGSEVGEDAQPTSGLEAYYDENGKLHMPLLF